MIPRDEGVVDVLPSGSTDATTRVDASPGAFGAQVGQAVGQTSQGFEQAAQAGMQIRQVNNIALVNDATTKLQNAANTIAFGDGTPNNPGFFGKQGADALSAYPQAQSSLTAAQSQIESGLPPDAQRDFQDYARRYVGSRLESFGDHFEQQRTLYTQQLAKSATDADQNTAISFYNDSDKFQSALSDGRFRIEQQSSVSGEAPEVTQQKLQDFTSGAYAGAASRIAEQDPVAAWKFYQDNQSLITGSQQAALEQRLKPQLYNWSSRADADQIMSGGYGQVAQNVSDEASRQGVDQGLALTTAKIESGMGARLQSPTSSASGVFGMMPATFREQGGTDPGDTSQQIQTGVKNLADSQRIADEAVGGNAEPWQTYFVHQQGAAGGPALLQAAPSMSAVDALTPAYNGNADAARRAIVANGGTADMTAGQFRNLWQATYERVASTVQVAAPGSTASVSSPGSTAPASGVSATPGLPTSSDPRDHVSEWLGQANAITSPLGTDDPTYQDLVASRIRQRTAEIEYGQAQSERASQTTLLNAALGLAAPNNPQPTPHPPADGQPAQTISAGPPGNPLSAMARNAVGAPPSTRPTSIDQLLATGPDVRAAWASASPQTQRGILEMVEKNASEGPPMTDQAQTRFYSLLSESTQRPDAFLRENLASPDLLSSMPRDYLHQLMDRQASIDSKAVEAQTRQADMTHARSVVMPDLLAAGINPRSAGSNPAQAQAYASFDGRLDESLQQFQQQNGRRPNDAEIKTIGQTLLTPGFQRGSGSLWGMLPNDTPQRLYQAQTAGTTAKFYPDVPAADRQQIISAYGSLHGGARPNEQEIQTYYVAGRSRMPSTAPRPVMSAPSASMAAAAAPAPATLPVAQEDDASDTSGPDVSKGY